MRNVNATKNIFKLKKIPFRQITFRKKNEDELGKIFTFFCFRNNSSFSINEY